MKKILVAPNELKGSLTARAAGDAIQQGILQAMDDAVVTVLPVADGGDGLLDSLQSHFSAVKKTSRVLGPLGQEIDANYLYSESAKLAVIEMAAASGLRLLSNEEYSPMLTSTYGTGQLIVAALNDGAEKIVLGIGGSATNDGGTGLASALGFKFFDEDGNILAGCAQSLPKIAAINDDDLDARLQSIEWQVICDVDNPLLGERGAAAVYGPQKGATPEDVHAINEGLLNYADLIESYANKSIRDVPGAGAAGGMGAGLLALFNATMLPGAECVLDLLKFDEALIESDLVITTEGKFDSQTVYGKAPGAIAHRAQLKNIPCVMFAGLVEETLDIKNVPGFVDAIGLCTNGLTTEYCMKNAAELLEKAVANYFAEDEDLSNQENRSYNNMLKKCLFPAAGYGTRFLPATKAMPKEILPIMQKPLIQYGVEEAMQAGMNEIAIITGRGKRAIEDHFDTNFELEHQISGTSKESALQDIRDIINECTFSYTRQVEMKGLGHAILCGETLIGNEPFGVILADDLCEGEDLAVMQQMADIFEKYRCCIIAIQEVDPEEVYKYGVIEGRELDDGVFIVSDMVEKPDPEDAPSNLAIIGRYILTPGIFDTLKSTPPGKNDELQLTDALQAQAKENMVIAYKFKGRRFDCGSLDGFVEATNYFYEKRKIE